MKKIKRKMTDGRSITMTRLVNAFRYMVCLSAALLLANAAFAQTTWYVDDDAPGDPGPGDPVISDPAEDGSAQHPFDAIQEAINAARAGTRFCWQRGAIRAWGIAT